MRIGFIGLGRMGLGIANNLQKAGFALVVHDINREVAKDLLDRGAAWADSPRDLARLVDVVFTSLPTPEDVENVAHAPDGLAAGLTAGSVWFDLSTNAVDVVRKLHAELLTQDVQFLDAPVSGGPGGAASGKMAIWVGGARSAYDAHQDVLNAMADKPSYIGEIGAGTIAKLVHNMASAAQNAIIAEVLSMGVKAGLEPLALWEAIRQGVAGRSRSFDNVSKRFLQGKLDPPSFPLRLVKKDVGLAMRLARDVGVPMRLCGLVFDDITEAMGRGWGDRDAQSFLVLQQERAQIPPFALTAEEVEAVIDRT